MIDTDNLLSVARRRRRLRAIRGCLTVAINAETELVAAFMIDEALRLSSAEWPRETCSLNMVHADASC